MRWMILALFFYAAPVWASVPENLWQDPEWLKLGYYEKRFYGAYRSRVEGTFFLADDGKESPRNELRATYTGMFEADAATQEKIQCKYPARRDFLVRKLRIPSEKIKTCSLDEEWVKKLNAKKVSVVFASAYLNSAASSFGHTFLKLHDPENKEGRELLDYGINFAARTEDKTGALYALYGLFGYFPGNFGLLPYHQLIREYTNLEGRDLWEYELTLNEEETRRLLYHLLELEGAYFYYYFLDDNCSYFLLKALEIARPGLQLLSDDEVFVIPLDTVKAATRSRGLVSQIKYRPSLDTQWKQRLDQLQDGEVSLIGKATEEGEEIFRLSDKALSAGQLYTEFKLNEAEDESARKKWAEINYAFSKEKAARGKPDDFHVRQPRLSPDLGKDSSQIAVSAYTYNTEEGLLLKFQPAFHDFVSSEVGASPRSHLEVFGIEGRFSFSEAPEIENVTLLKILSSQASDPLFRQSSWGLTAELDRVFPDDDFLRANIRLSWGLRGDYFGEKLSVLFLFLSPRLGENQERVFKLSMGADLLVKYDWSSWSRISLSAGSQGFNSDELTQGELTQVFDLGRSFELRMSAFHTMENLPGGDLRSLTEGRLGLHHFFLF